MDHEELLLKNLARYINQTMVNDIIGVYFIKEQVGRIRNLKVEIYSNDHNPPHFHVKSNDNSINATFRIDNGELINGLIDKNDRKRIEAFCRDPHNQLLMKDTWNKSKPNNKKVN
jgi:hypothetical protein